MPVCGKDGKTYQNSCHLEKAGVTKDYDGWCKTFKGPNSSTDTAEPEKDFNDKTEENGYLPAGQPYLECPCNYKFNPVCGANGITYANACRATCKRISIAAFGECRNFKAEPPTKKLCECSFTTLAVCAGNGVTYENECVAKCFDVKVERIGICDGPCSCQFFFNPVCGEDGRNYVNQCEMDCAHVAKYSDGLCSQASKCNHCYGPIKRVCGKDEKTYDNECYAKCAGTSILYEGYCVNKQDGQCLCPAIYLPVCGKDNVTYSNECELNCAGVGMAKFGKCKSDDKDDNKCRNSCYKDKYEPVCGTNTVTYYNKDMIGCDSGISVLYEGECKPIYVPNCQCPIKLEPVCGADGRTYYNECVARYVGVDIYCTGTCELNGNGWKMINSAYSFDMSNSGSKNTNNDRNMNNMYLQTGWYNQNGGCRGNKCEDKKNRCCNIDRSQCCMNEDGRCCNDDDDDDDDFKRSWDKNPQDCEWECDSKNNSCKPKITVPYILVKKPCRNNNCASSVKPFIYYKLPPVPNSSSFNYHSLGIYYPFIGNFFPYPTHISDCLLSGFGAGKSFNINALLGTLFKNGRSYSANSFNVDISIDIDIDINVQQRDIKQKKQEKVNRCINSIPAQHKQVISQNATLYYVYFYILLQQNLCTQDTEVYSGYTVKDILLFIIRDVWGLQIDEDDDFGSEFKYDSDDNSDMKYMFSNNLFDDKRGLGQFDFSSLKMPSLDNNWGKTQNNFNFDSSKYGKNIKSDDFDFPFLGSSRF